MKRLVISSENTNWENEIRGILENEYLNTPPYSNHKYIYIIKFWVYKDNGMSSEKEWLETTFDISDNLEGDFVNVCTNDYAYECTVDELIDKLYNIHDFEIYEEEAKNFIQEH